MATTRSVSDILAEEKLCHPYATAVNLFDYPHLPGPHLEKLYHTFYRAVDPAYPNAPTNICALLPRGEGKSESGGVVIPTWTVLRHPHLRVAVVSKTRALAAERTGKAVEYIQRHADRFGIDLDEPVPSTELRTAENDHTVPTLAPYGLESQLTGRHFDVIVYDDIVDWENQRTATQRRNVRNYWEDYEKNLPDDDSALPQGAVQLVIGTRKHPQDIYATNILESHRWHTMIHRAIAEEDWPLVENRRWQVRGTDGEIYDDVGEMPESVDLAPGGVMPEEDIRVLWPQRRSAGEVLYDLVDDDTSLAIWRRENQLDPGALSNTVFKSDWMHFVDELPYPAASYDWHAAMDVAVVEDAQRAAEGNSDFTAVSVAAVERGTDAPSLFMFKPEYDRGLSVKGNRDFGVRAVDRVLDGYDVELTDMVVEANKAPGVAQRLRDETDLPARPVDSTDNKEARIHDFGGAVESAEVKFVGDATSDEWEDFEKKEWLQFPNAEHDDRLDSMAILWRELESGDDSWSGSDVGLGGL
jgi:hypothetical protein